MPFSGWQLSTHFIFSRDLPFNYVVNPKAGCSTILQHLWGLIDLKRNQSTFPGNPHRGGPWDRLSASSTDAITDMLGKPTFSMVRNPYARVLSAYLSKVGDRRAEEDQYVWNEFRARFGLAEDEVPSFARYLDLIESEPVEKWDRHWAPQTHNLLQPQASIDRLFYLEHFPLFEAYLDRFAAGGIVHSPLGVRDAARQLKEHLTPEIAARIAKLYAIDFATFGYSENPKSQAPTKPVDWLPGQPTAFLDLLRSHAAATPFGVVDLVRGREIAGWLHFEGDSAALTIRVQLGPRDIEVPVRPAGGDDANVHLFNAELPIAANARDLLMGKVKVFAVLGEAKHVLKLWEPIRMAGEVSGYDVTMLRRLRHALPRGILGSLTRDPVLPPPPSPPEEGA